MLNSIFNAVADVLRLQRRDTGTEASASSQPEGQHIQLLDHARRNGAPCWQRYADQVRALFWPSPQAGRRVAAGPASAPLADLRGRRVELDRLWMSFEGASLEGTSLVLSDRALRGITAGADSALPVGLCMALQSLSTIDARHADVRAAVLRQIVLALGTGEKGVAPEVSAVLRAYCDTTPWFAGVAEVEGLLGRGAG